MFGQVRRDLKTFGDVLGGWEKFRESSEKVGRGRERFSKVWRSSGKVQSKFGRGWKRLEEVGKGWKRLERLGGLHRGSESNFGEV